MADQHMARHFFVLVVEQGGIELDPIAGDGALLFENPADKERLINRLAAISYLRKRRMA